MNFNLFANKTLVIFGLGVTGISVVKFLSKSKSDVKIIICDDNNDKICKIKSEYSNIEGTTDINSIDWKNIDYLVLSPGVPLTFPTPHKVVQLAKENNCEIICDVEIAYLVNERPDFIGITGTNGKSTTTSLIGHILKNSNINSQIGGNIGIPILQLDHNQDVTNIVELSSFQLDLVQKSRFNVAIFLNITPDHIDRHGNIENYVEAKTKIFSNQQFGDVAAISIDDAYSQAVYKQLQAKSKATIIPFSVNKELENGVSLIDNTLIDNTGSGGQYKLPVINNLLGKHNAQNMVAAYVTVKSYNVDFNKFIEAAQSFLGLRHRMQYVTYKENIAFINDSKATNADSSSKALETYDNIYWIVGGVSKYGGISSLKEYFPKVTKAYLIGQSQDEFANIIDNEINYDKFSNLKEAVFQSFNDASLSRNENPVILFSPACASFDQWRNFELRGDDFIELVNSL